MAPGTLAPSHARFGRWAELSDSDLAYYSSHLEATPKGVLPLACIRRVLPSRSEARRFSLRVAAPEQRTSSAAGDARTTRHLLLATAATKPFKTIELQAVDAIARDRWVRALTLLTGGGGAGGGGSGSDGSGGSARFGQPLASAQLAQDGRGLHVPSVLLALWEALSSREPAAGLASEGIFRLSAPADEVAAVKGALDASDSSAGKAAVAAASPQCLAALIKLYLRELPDDLWAPVRAELPALMDGWAAEGGGAPSALAAHPAVHAAAQQLLWRLSERAAAIIVWCCDVMAAIITHEPSNRMGLSAAATVFAPGLVPPPAASTDPASLLEWTGRGVRLTSLLLQIHLQACLRPTVDEPPISSRQSSDTPSEVPDDPADPTSDDAAMDAADAANAAAARLAAQADVYVATEGGDGGGALRKKRFSTEERTAGLEALLAEMEVNGSEMPIDRVASFSVRKSSADV